MLQVIFMVLIIINSISIKQFQCVDHVWHGYKFDPNHAVREELVISNVTAQDGFHLGYPINRWIGKRIDEIYYAFGLLTNGAKEILVSLIESDPSAEGFRHTSRILEIGQKVVDVSLLEQWNSSLKKSSCVVAIATENHKVLWYLVQNDTNVPQIWSWTLDKEIHHLNFFQIEFTTHLLVVSEHLGQFSADLYEFDLKALNFWLKQKLPLNAKTNSSSFTQSGPNLYLSIPQIISLQIYQLVNGHFVSYKNLTSPGVNEVISFNVGSKKFIAFNGLGSGIYEFTRKQGPIRQQTDETTNLQGVYYWLPIVLHNNREETLLVTQKILRHEPHLTFVIEVLTYDGSRWIKHEDVPCLYFGEQVLGLSCLPGEEAANGIVGSISVSVGGKLGMLVPRIHHHVQNLSVSSSEMFLFDFEYKQVVNPVRNEVEALLKMKQYLASLLASQQDQLEILQDGQNKTFTVDLVKSSGLQVDSATDFKEKLDEISAGVIDIGHKIRDIRQNENLEHYSTVIFNGQVEVEEPATFNQMEVDKIDEEFADLLLEDLVLKTDLNVREIKSPKTFLNLIVEDLSFDEINNKTDLGPIVLNKDVTLNQVITITEGLISNTINDKKIPEDIVHISSRGDRTKLKFKALEVLEDLRINMIHNARKRSTISDVPFEDTHFDFLFAPDNISVVNVNDQNFMQLLKQICMRNLKTFVPGDVVVDGNVVITEELKTDVLNNLQFPLGYVFMGSSVPNITGRKSFLNRLSTDQLNIEGLLDGVNISEIVTLNTSQEIPSNITFENLEVTEKLYIGGHVVGEYAKKFLPNPTIADSDSIKANVIFSNLEVQGSIILRNELNGRELEQILSDIIYKDEQQVIIDSIKDFQEGFSTKNLTIESNMVNEIELNAIVTKNGVQTLTNYSVLHGIVELDQIQVNGTYDGVNVEKFDQESVKLNGDQYISSTLIFKSPIEANNLSLGNISGNKSNLEDIESWESVEVRGDFVGTINNLRSPDFGCSHDSLTVDNLDSFTINDLPSRYFNSEHVEATIREKISNGDIQIESLYINGSVDIEEINHQNAINLPGFLFASRNSNNLTKIAFMDNIYVDHLTLQNFSGVDFDRYVQSIVFKDETNNLELSGTKTFKGGFTVHKLVETEKLNSVPIDQILTKQGQQKVIGPLEILTSEVHFQDNITLTETLNNMSPELFVKHYHFLENGDNEVLGDIVFSRLAHVNNLEIVGYINDKLSAPELMNSIVYKDGDVINLQGETIFENLIIVNGNMSTDKIDDMDLSEVVSDIVLLSDDQKVDGSVRFTQPISVNDKILLRRDLETKVLGNIRLEDWVENGIFVNKGLLKGHYVFENVQIVENLRADYINDINVNKLVPLRIKQTLPELKFEEISCITDIPVGNTTNSYYLPQEVLNTVTLNSDQKINSPSMQFNSKVFVGGNVQFKGLLNNLDFHKIVTTNTDQNLTDAIYEFNAKTFVDGNLIVTELINGIRLNTWIEQGAKTFSNLNESQEINRKWVVDKDMVFMENVSGDGTVNGINLRDFADIIEEKRNFRYQMEKGFVDDYTNICKDLTFMHEQLRTQIYRFDYFDEGPEVLEFQNLVEYSFTFVHNNELYILITEENKCESQLFMYKDHQITLVSVVDMGKVSQIVSIATEEEREFFMVVNNENMPSCNIKDPSTNLWQFNDKNFTHVINVERQDLLQDSTVPGAFYGLSGSVVTEFKFQPNLQPGLFKFRKWTLGNVDDLQFFPRGLQTGLALTSGSRLFKLQRGEQYEETVTDSFEEILLGHFTEELIGVQTKKNQGQIVVKVGTESTKRSLFAVLEEERTSSVKGSWVFVKIYEDIYSGRMFHKVPVYRPTSMISMDFDNGETLLVVLEDNNQMQVHEYKGIEGFKHRFSAKVEGSKLFKLHRSSVQPQVIGLVNRNKVKFIRTVMRGNRIEEDLQCSL